MTTTRLFSAPFPLGASQRGVHRRHKHRMHVNPLSSAHQQRLDLPEGFESSIFEDPSLPLHVDLGCGTGEHLSQLASIRPEWNFLGLEIRPSLLRVTPSELPSNCHVLTANVNVNYQVIMDALGASAAAGWRTTIKRVSASFPDPHFKKKHAKRRMLTAALVDQISHSMKPGCDGEIFFQTDVDELYNDTAPLIAQRSDFQVIYQRLQTPSETHYKHPSVLPFAEALSQYQNMSLEKRTSALVAKHVN